MGNVREYWLAGLRFMDWKRDTGRQGLRKRNGGRIFTGMAESPVPDFPVFRLAYMVNVTRVEGLPEALVREWSREDRV